MGDISGRRRWLAPVAFGAALLGAGPAAADECDVALSLMDQGLSVVEAARQSGIPSSAIAACMRARRQTILVPKQNRRFGPAGPPPVGAAGPPPGSAAGDPPRNPAGPPPLNPAGPGPGAVVE